MTNFSHWNYYALIYVLLIFEEKIGFQNDLPMGVLVWKLEYFQSSEPVVTDW